MNEIEQMIYDDQQRQRNYITFLLGSDNFDICHFIRNLAVENGNIDEIYDNCDCIASKFAKYDRKNQDIMGEYESFEHFLRDYDEQIRKFFKDGIDFYIEEDLNNV